MSPLTAREVSEIDRANATAKTPVVFVHGLWLLASSWAAWRAHFETAGYTTLAPGWPEDPESIAEGRANPGRFANKGVTEVANHVAELISKLKVKPLLVGHSVGGLLVQNLAGRGLATATVAIDPAPSQGVLPLPFSALKAVATVLGNPFNFSKAILLTPAQFRYGFTNAVSEREASELYEKFAVPAPARPLFQVAGANVNPWSQTKVDKKNPERGPLLIISGEKDNTVPHSMSFAAFKTQKSNPGVTEFKEISGRGHSLTIDSGWQEVADAALGFFRQHSRTA